MDSKEELQIQAKSLAIYLFLDEYNLLENIVLEEFKTEVKNIDQIKTNILYFFSGGKASFYLSPEKLSITADPQHFDEEKKFEKFSLNEILKIDEKLRIIPFLDKTISLKQSMADTKVRDCIRSFVRMRNRLAHKIHDVSFKNGDCIEFLSVEKILESKLIVDFGIYRNVMDDITQEVLSNVVYMDEVVQNIK